MNDFLSLCLAKQTGQDPPKHTLFCLLFLGWDVGLTAF